MLGLMQGRPLLISGFLTHAARYHGTREIVSRMIEGPIHRTSYQDVERRARRLATAMTGLGLKPGMRVGTLAWNGFRHMEIWYATSGSGAVTHTINPRLFPEQIVYIANHAQDRILFVDLTFLPLVENLIDRMTGISTVVAMTDHTHLPKASKIPHLIAYEDLIQQGSETYDWPEFDENTASSLCYTSGTTGNPKGVLYSHRSTAIHSLSANGPDGLAMSSRDCAMPVVPMFHANAWSIPYGAAIAGAKLVFPGAKLDGPSIHELLESEQVTFTAAVPTVWLNLLQYLETANLGLSSLKRVVIGGSACPRAMIETFETKFGVEVSHAWGMTEMSPLGTVGALKADMPQWPLEKRMEVKAKQGRAVFGVEMKIVDEENRECPHDGKSFGRLKVRGPWIVRAYFGEEDHAILDEQGYFDTGDVATIDAEGYMQITDRAKDVIKSGGEWISSIELENLAVGHPDVAEAAVIGCPHPKWDERPVLIIVCKPGRAVSAADMRNWLDGKIANWWKPDEIVFVEEIPHTATGKILKTELRERYKKLLTDAAGK